VTQPSLGIEDHRIIFARIRKVSFCAFADALAPSLAIAQA